MKTDVNVPSKSNKQNIFENNYLFYWHLVSHPDPDPFRKKKIAWIHNPGSSKNCKDVRCRKARRGHSGPACLDNAVFFA
jgi:hypothetical protein